MLVRPHGSVLNKEQVLNDLRERGLTCHRINLENPVVRVFGSMAILDRRKQNDIVAQREEHKCVHPACCGVGSGGGRNPVGPLSEHDAP